jgi:DNA-binding beta-propeller fold protein YncE
MMRLAPIIVAVLLLISVTALAQQPSVPEIPFESVPDLLKLPPDLYLGEAAGVALNSKGHIFVYTRSRQTRLFEFDRDGKFLREIGKDLYGFDFAHVVRVDKNDNIWCVDEGANVVVEFNPEGREVMVLGRKWEAVEGRPEQPKPGSPPPVARPGLFNRPTDVAWNPAGDIFISDGYNNSRVAKFDKDGEWVKSWGQRGKGPGEFNLPHSIATDAKGNVYVGDRSNNRIQVFDSEGNFLKEFTGIGAPWAICVTPGPKQFLYTSDSIPGRIYKLDLDGNILGVFGAPGKKLKEFGWVHEMDCHSENEIYVAELLNWRVQKLILHPQKRESLSSH